MDGSPLKQARLAAGLTLRELAQQLSRLGYGITAAGISKYEIGKSKPPPSFLHAAGRILAVKPAHLVRSPAVTVDWLNFRKHSRLSQRDQNQIKAWASTIVEKQIALQQLLFPHIRTGFPKPRPCTSHEDAEEAAETLRRKWGLADIPIESVTEALEDRGGVVVEYPRHVRRFDGLCGWADRFPVIVVSANVPDDRQRLSLAHELGHLVMDCSRVSPSIEEHLVFRFAAAFIVPAAVAWRELGTKRKSLLPQELALLKRKHGLSMQGWIRRARDLEIITQGHYETLFRRFSALGWRTTEPVAYEGHERATRLKQLVLRALAEGIITPSRASEIVPGIHDEMTIDAQGKVPPTELLKLPRKERRRRLAESARVVAKHYTHSAA